jgi:hypothetical protein
MIIRMRGRLLKVRWGALGAVLSVVLTGCGATDAGAPAAPVSKVPAAPTSEPAPAPAPANKSEHSAQLDTSGPSFGVDRTMWPATAKSAYKLLNSLPQSLHGEALDVSYEPADKEEGFGASAEASYGEAISISVFDEYVTRDTESREPELFAVDKLLAADFGLVYGCAKGSYRGTIKRSGDGPGFQSAKGKSASASQPMWFSCKIDGAEGNENFKGHAVGWTSKKAAWLVIAEDDKAARSLIAGLVVPSK